MKKLLVVLMLSPLALAGCGLFTSNHAWKEAKQENPLQIPPGLDQPATTAAVTIPPPQQGQATPASQTAQPPATANANTTGASMHLDEDVDEAYKRVGLALQMGDIGTVTSHDAAMHLYRLSIDTTPTMSSSPSFLQKHFSNINQKQAATTSDTNQTADDEAGKVTVTVTVSPDSSGGSTVLAWGDPRQSAHVISVLRSRLGG